MSICAWGWVIHWSMETLPVAPPSKRWFSITLQLSTANSSLLSGGPGNHLSFYVGIFAEWILGKQPQLLWAHGVNSYVMSRRKHPTTLVPFLQLLYSFQLLFHNVPWARRSWSWHRCPTLGAMMKQDIEYELFSSVLNFNRFESYRDPEKQSQR